MRQVERMVRGEAMEEPFLDGVVVEGAVDVDGADGGPGDAALGEEGLGVELALLVFVVVVVFPSSSCERRRSALSLRAFAPLKSPSLLSSLSRFSSLTLWRDLTSVASSSRCGIWSLFKYTPADEQ